MDVDHKIQSLMSELQELYNKRHSLCYMQSETVKEARAKKKAVKCARITKLSSINATTIQSVDLSLTDLLQPTKRRHIFSK